MKQKKKIVKFLVTVKISHDDDAVSLKKAITTAKEDTLKTRTSSCGLYGFINTPLKAKFVNEDRPSLDEIRSAFDIVDRVKKNQIKVHLGKRYHKWVMEKDKNEIENKTNSNVRNLAQNRKRKKADDTRV